jgi:hypothetical protein
MTCFSVSATCADPKARRLYDVAAAAYLKRLSRRSAALLLALALGAAFLAGPATAAAAPYKDGDKVQVSGLITGTDGAPIAGVQVTLEMARRYLSLRELRRALKDERRVKTVTNARGEYTLEWPWDGYFNHFELLAGATVRRGKVESLEILEREDISDRVLAGSPVAMALVVRNRAFVDHLNEFVASVRSADERRTYEELGVPDDVKRVNYTGRPQEIEVSWWYFDAGKVYRFHDGRLEHVDRFDPVQRF